MLEDYIWETNRTFQAISLLTDILYNNAEEDWNIYSENQNREDSEKIMTIIYTIKVLIYRLKKYRKIYYKKMCLEKYKN